MMKVVVAKEKEPEFPRLEVGDVIVLDNQLFTLMQHKEGYMFTRPDGGGYNGCYTTLEAITEKTKTGGHAYEGKLFRASEYELHLVPKK